MNTRSLQLKLGLLMIKRLYSITERHLACIAFFPLVLAIEHVSYLICISLPSQIALPLVFWVPQ